MIKLVKLSCVVATAAMALACDFSTAGTGSGDVKPDPISCDWERDRQYDTAVARLEEATGKTLVATSSWCHGGECFVAGFTVTKTADEYEGVMLHRDPKTSDWTVELMEGVERMTLVSGNAAGDVYAASVNMVSGPHEWYYVPSSRLWRHTGAGWVEEGAGLCDYRCWDRAEDTRPWDSELASLSVAQDGTVYVAVNGNKNDGTTWPGSYTAAVLVKRGDSWARTALVGERADARIVVGVSATDAYVAGATSYSYTATSWDGTGEYVNWAERAMLRRFDGKAWQDITGGLPSADGDSSVEVVGVSERGGEVYLAAYMNVFDDYSRTPDDGGYVMKSADANNWSATRIGDDHRVLCSVISPADGYAMAIGCGGTVATEDAEGGWSAPTQAFGDGERAVHVVSASGDSIKSATVLVDSNAVEQRALYRCRQ